MNNIALYQRRTRAYVDSFRHLDRHDFLCSIRLTPPRWIRCRESFDDAGTYVMSGRIPSGISRKAIIDAAEETLTHWDCHHTHDCCGCRLTRAKARIQGRKLFVTVKVSFNY